MAEYVQVGWLKPNGSLISDRAQGAAKKAGDEGWKPVFVRAEDAPAPEPPTEPEPAPAPRADGLRDSGRKGDGTS